MNSLQTSLEWLFADVQNHFVYFKKISKKNLVVLVKCMWCQPCFLMHLHAYMEMKHQSCTAGSPKPT